MSAGCGHDDVCAYIETLEAECERLWEVVEEALGPHSPGDVPGAAAAMNAAYRAAREALERSEA